MKIFDNAIKTMRGLQDNLTSFQNILKESEKNPEVLLTESFLPTEADRIYVLTKLMIDSGKDVFDTFISEYFEQILKVLALKIPINEVVLNPAYYNDEYVLIGIIDDIPKMVINTFEKTVSFISDERILSLYKEEDESINLITELEGQLENLSTDNNAIVWNKKKHAERINEKTNMIISQLGIEKQNLSRIREDIEICQQYNDGLQSILDRYASRLVNYYQYSIIRTANKEQYI